MKGTICLIILYCISASSFESKIDQLHSKLFFESENIGKFHFLKQQIQKVKIYEKTCFEELHKVEFPLSCFKYIEYLIQTEIHPSSELIEKVKQTCKFRSAKIQNKSLIMKYLETHKVSFEFCRQALNEQLDLLEYRESEIE